LYLIFGSEALYCCWGVCLLARLRATFSNALMAVVAVDSIIVSLSLRLEVFRSRVLESCWFCYINSFSLVFSCNSCILYVRLLIWCFSWRSLIVCLLACYYCFIIELYRVFILSSFCFKVVIRSIEGTILACKVFWVLGLILLEFAKTIVAVCWGVGKRLVVIGRRVDVGICVVIVRFCRFTILSNKLSCKGEIRVVKASV